MQRVGLGAVSTPRRAYKIWPPYYSCRSFLRNFCKGSLSSSPVGAEPEEVQKAAHYSKAKKPLVGVPDTAKVGMFGICCDANSSFLRGPSKAPPLIRAALVSDSANVFCELGTDGLEPVLTLPDIRPKVRSLPDLLPDLVTRTAATVKHDVIEKRIHGILDAGLCPLVLGGDNAVTYPVVKALAEWRRANVENPSFAILHFDAHTDLYDELGGNRLSHASPYARILELNDVFKCGKGEEMTISLVQLGIRTLNPHQRDQIKKFNVTSLEMKDFPPPQGISSFLHNALLAPSPSSSPSSSSREMADARSLRPLDVFVSIDIDCLDPAFAPGVSHLEPGGMSTRELLSVLHALPKNVRVIGGDCVEVNPDRDINGMTAMVAAKLCKELIGHMSRTN